MNGTGLAPVPDKARGHLTYALNVSCPIIRVISSQHCRPFHLLCATVASPFAYKRRPWVHWKMFRLFGTRQHPELAHKLKNTQYIHQAGLGFYASSRPEPG